MLYGASRPHTECFITHTAHTVHAITNLLCFCTKLCCDSYSMASSFDPLAHSGITSRAAVTHTAWLVPLRQPRFLVVPTENIQKWFFVVVCTAILVLCQ